MITVETTRFGSIDIADPRIVTMREGGIIGFSHLKTFVLLIPDEKKPFWWLQSLEDGSIAFIVTDPFKVLAGYETDLSLQAVQLLDIEDTEDVAMLCIVTVNKAPQFKITVNLRAPIIVNTKSMVARQIVLERDDYEIRYEIKAVKETVGQGAVEKIRAVCNC
jgi:flagellar assembly factor FliW